MSTKENIVVLSMGQVVHTSKAVRYSARAYETLRGSDSGLDEEKQTEGAEKNLESGGGGISFERAPVIFLKPGEKKTQRRHALTKAVTIAAE